MEIRNLLEQLTRTNESHARLLNSLSYLEYRGFRKIVRSQTTENIDEELLTHVLEEVRHALYFKKLAVKIGGLRYQHYETDTLLSEHALKAYFYDLDKGVEELYFRAHSLRADKTIYRLVTWLIEERAMKVYSAYERILLDGNFDFSLRPILADESKHLNEVRQISRAALGKINLSEEKLFGFENECFFRFWSAMSRNLNRSHEANL